MAVWQPSPLHGSMAAFSSTVWQYGSLFLYMAVWQPSPLQYGSMAAFSSTGLVSAAQETGGSIFKGVLI